MRRLLLFFSVAFAASFAGLAHAQEQSAGQPTAQAVAGRVLTQALESGAISRVLGNHHLFFRKSFDVGSIVIFNGQLLGDEASPTGLRCRMALIGLSGTMAGRELQTSYDIGFDGVIQRFEVMQAFQGRGGIAEGVVSGLLVDVSTRVAGGGGVSKRQLAWSEQALPFLVALFLARLHDQGLPDELRYRMFEGEDLRLNDFESSLVLGEGEGTEVTVTCRKRVESGDQEYVIVLEGSGERPGRLVRIQVGESGLMDPISEEEFKRLLGSNRAPNGQSPPPDEERGQGEKPAPTPETPKQD